MRLTRLRRHREPGSREGGSVSPADADGTLVAELSRELGPEQVRSRPLDLAALSHDASHFLLRPRVAVIARDGGDVAAAMAVARRHGVPVTFRAGGTSLSGQAGTDGVLVDVRRRFRGFEILDGGARVRCEPGVTLREVNAALLRHGAALGPDPASEVACTIGGVVANNSSGMTCGTEANAYRTLAALRVALLSGTVVDTGERDADARLRHDEPRLWEGLAALRDEIRGTPVWVARIRHQFSMKNTMGYGLNSFLDHDDPAQILAHLMVGSEGTLGFVLSATFDTLPRLPEAATGLLVFDDARAAADALPDLVAAGARTAELMDAACLRVAQRARLDAVEGMRIGRQAALLVELAEADAAALAERVEAAAPVLAGLAALARPADLATDPALRKQLWRVRKGLHTAVAGPRPVGTTALLEDVAVPMRALPDTVDALGELCGRHGYDDAVVFGHARDANLHFMLTADLGRESEVERYAVFTEDLVDLVLAADGTLKAEHGTGRIMAPYVRRQYGDALYEVMVRVKDLFDPGRILGRGVIIGDDPVAHLRHLKVGVAIGEQAAAVPQAEACVECGYCEPVCPSRDLTTTPRQRIALLRDLALASAAERAAIEADFGDAAIDTCAVDGLCALECPVGIDTGALMKSLRERRHSAASQEVGRRVAEHWGATLDGLRLGVALAGRMSPRVRIGTSRLARAVAAREVIPLVGEDLPAPGRTRATTARRPPGDVILFPSCLSELFAPAPTPPASPPCAGGAGPAFLALCDRAGVRAVLPEGVHDCCCGTVWRSKGLTAGLGVMAPRTASALLAASRQGRDPIVSDSSSCTQGLRALPEDLGRAGHAELADRVAGLRILDAVEYVAQHLLPALPPARRLASVVVHPTCADYRAEGVDSLLRVASAGAQRVEVPPHAGCCGFAGDRGMLHPELTASASEAEAAEVCERAYDAYVSTNRTCEAGMSRATGRPYRHVLEVLEEATR